MQFQCFVHSAGGFLSSRRKTSRIYASPAHQHGGGWRIGNRTLQRHVQSPDLRRGYPCGGRQTATPVCMADDSSSVSLVTRVGAVLSVIGLIAVSFIPIVGLFQNGGSGAGADLVNAQLSKVPVFTVTDSSGHPFMAETADHRLRLGYFFIQPADAAKYLERVRDEASDAKVLVISLNEAAKFLDSKSTPPKQVPERFELFPDEHEADLAREVTDGKFQEAFGPSGVPIFYIDGLGVKNESEGAVVFPLFFEKERLDETVASLKKSDPQATIDMKDLQVIDLKQTIKEIRAGGNSKFSRVVFVPLTQSVQAMKGTAENGS